MQSYQSLLCTCLFLLKNIFQKLIPGEKRAGASDVYREMLKKSPQYYNLLRALCLEEDFSGTTAPIWMPFGVRSGFGHSLPHTKGQPNRTTNSWEIALVILTGKMEKEGGIHRDSFSVLQLFCFIFTKRFLRNYCTDLDALWCVASWDQTLTWHQRTSKSDDKRLRNRTGDYEWHNLIVTVISLYK